MEVFLLFLSKNSRKLSRIYLPKVFVVFVFFDVFGIYTFMSQYFIIYGLIECAETGRIFGQPFITGDNSLYSIKKGQFFMLHFQSFYIFVAEKQTNATAYGIKQKKIGHIG